jgi:hypothetical protein
LLKCQLNETKKYKYMQNIISAISPEIIIRELAQKGPVKTTKRLNHEIHLVSAIDCPHTMLELGRLREITFRAAKGGTGKAVDIDEYDYLFHHLLVWNPLAQDIVGSYRCQRMDKLLDGAIIQSPTGNLFNFSSGFIREYLPKTIELGRSFVQPKYQPRVDNKSGMFSLFNLFSGLEYLVSVNPDIQYLFGKFTMYPSYNVKARNLLLSYILHKFPDPERLVRPKKEFRLKYVERNLLLLQSILNQATPQDQKRALETHLLQYGEYIQALVSVYMGLSNTMKSFGTAKHHEFGDTYETGILINRNDIYPEIIEKYRANLMDIV